MPPSITSFRRGNSAGRGRPKGSPNKVTAEVQRFARDIVEDPEYRENLRTAARNRKLHPQVEIMLWNYAYGKPKDEMTLRLEMAFSQELEALQDAQRQARLVGEVKVAGLLGEGGGNSDDDEDE